MRLLDRYANDFNADDGYYWRRFTGMVRQHHEWPRYTDWSIYLNAMDEHEVGSSRGYTLDSAADFILGTVTS
jgi:hypothetical protein